MTIIRNFAGDSGKNDYRLPAVVFSLPEGKAGLELKPKPGLRIRLNTRDNQIIVYNPQICKLETIYYTLIDQAENVDEGSPLVFDSLLKKERSFPVVDMEKRTITIYSRRQRIVTTFSLPENYFRLPEYTWAAGDEIRIYYTVEGRAQRLTRVNMAELYRKVDYLWNYTPMIFTSTLLRLRPSNSP